MDMFEQQGALFEPQDANFQQQRIMIGNILECMQAGLYDYVEDGSVDVRLIEFILMNCGYTGTLVVRNVPEKDIPGSTVRYKQAYKIYSGSGLLRTLKFYLLQDNPLNGLVSLVEFEGKRFSEFPVNLQRRIKEHYVDFIVDRAFYGENEIIAKQYSEMLNNLK